MTENAPFDIAVLASDANPYPYYKMVRDRTPVVRTDIGWIVLGHAEVDALLRSRDTRTGYLADNFRAALPAGAARDEMVHRINFLDAPDHTRVRKLSVKAFTPKRIAALEPFVRSLCQSMVDELPNDGPVDIFLTFAHAIPTLVISELLGIPAEDRDVLGRQASEVAVLLSIGLTPHSDETFNKAISSAEKMHDYLRHLIAQRRAEPKDDLLSALIAAEENGDQLNEKELLSLAATLYSAGHRSTHDFFANTLTNLLEHPESRKAFQDGALPVAHVVEESLRFTTPTFYVGRRTAAPVEIGGVTIPENETAILILGAANHDPRAYAEPDRFVPERWAAEPPPPAVLSFAFGPHFCLGAHLARMEVAIMIETLFATYPELEFAQAPCWGQHGIYRSVDSLVLNLAPRA